MVVWCVGGGGEEVSEGGGVVCRGRWEEVSEGGGVVCRGRWGGGE